MFKAADYLDFTQTEHVALFEGTEYVWDALKQISVYLKFRLKPAILGRMVGKPFVSDQVFVGEGTVIDPGAYLVGPAWIGENCHVRHGAYVRENVIVGDGCVLGNSCELKNSVLFNGAQVPHFSYVGDSILGHRAHLGAGVILSNLRLDQKEIVIRHEGQTIATGLRKFGAIVGDQAEVGCNAVLNPGSILGRKSLVFPTVSWRGVLPAGGKTMTGPIRTA
ncbi:MAG: UDP-N-acetylglucosamine diphosphorylase [Verrucomicrobiales bacterium]|jgi:NDP-sugar pyrophosphorylase family protein|nr:UDP-N-acetylglucosamine diphosphorylase [Verrucomicrobiales bacterium]